MTPSGRIGGGETILTRFSSEPYFIHRIAFWLELH